MTHHVCICKLGFDTWRQYNTHILFSKNYLCSTTVLDNEDITFTQDEDDDLEEDQYIPSHNQRVMDSISGELPHDHPSRVDNDLGDSTYLILQEQNYDSIYGKDALIATNLRDFYNLSRKPDNKTRAETDIYDYVVRNNISRNEADNLVNIVKSCAAEEYVDKISGKLCYDDLFYSKLEFTCRLAIDREKNAKWIPVHGL